MPNLSNQKIITNRQLNFTFSPVDAHNPKEMPYKLHNYEIDGTWNHHQSIIFDVILDRIVRGYYQQCYKRLPKSWRSKQTIETLKNFFEGMINPDTILSMSLTIYNAFSQYTGEDILEKLKKEYKYYGQDQCKTFRQYVGDHFDQNRVFQEFSQRVEGQLKALNKDLTVPIDILKLFEAYPFLKRYRYTLIDHLKKIEQTRFKMTYKVKYMLKEPSFDENGKMEERGHLIDLNYQMEVT